MEITHHITENDGFLVAGIAVKTSNDEGRSQFDIGELWGKFMVDKLADEIPGKVSEDIYCVYTDYETDHTGNYTALLGCKVNSIDELPGGFTGIAVPGGKYRVYIPHGPLPQSVTNAWQTIWETEIGRSYAADYDVYYADSKTRVEIFLGVED